MKLEEVPPEAVLIASDEECKHCGGSINWWATIGDGGTVNPVCCHRCRAAHPEYKPEAEAEGAPADDGLARWIVEQAIDWQMRSTAAGAFQCAPLTQLVDEVFAAYRQAEGLTRQGKEGA